MCCLHIWRSAKMCFHHSVFHKVLNAECSVLIRIFVVLYSKQSANYKIITFAKRVAIY